MIAIIRTMVIIGIKVPYDLIENGSDSTDFSVIDSIFLSSVDRYCGVEVSVIPV
jgi:hypothetical protein